MFWPPEGPLNTFDLNIQTRYNVSAIRISLAFLLIFYKLGPLSLPQVFLGNLRNVIDEPSNGALMEGRGCGDYTRSPAEAMESESESRSVLSNFATPWTIQSMEFFGPDTGVGSLSLRQGIFPIQGSNPGLPHCRRILYQLSHQGSPRILEWVACPFAR